MIETDWHRWVIMFLWIGMHLPAAAFLYWLIEIRLGRRGKKGGA